jgi:hypothetical protein
MKKWLQKQLLKSAGGLTQFNLSVDLQKKAQPIKNDIKDTYNIYYNKIMYLLNTLKTDFGITKIDNIDIDKLIKNLEKKNKNRFLIFRWETLNQIFEDYQELLNKYREITGEDYYKHIVFIDEEEKLKQYEYLRYEF